MLLLSKNIQLKLSFHYTRGNIYRKQGEYELAIADYAQAIELDPNYTEAYINWTVVQFERYTDESGTEP